MEGFSAEQVRDFALGGLDPYDLDSLRVLFVSGALHLMWRNGPIENVHSEKSGPSDGEMFRMNTYLTWLIQTVFDGWAQQEAVTSFDGVSREQLAGLMEQLRGIVDSPASRVAPNLHLGDIAGDATDDILDQFEGATLRALELAEQFEPSTPLYMWVVDGKWHRHGWGSPQWQSIVTRYLRTLDAPEDAHWTGHYETQAVPVIRLISRDELETLLRERPWDTPEPVADAVVRSGIGFIQPG